MNIKKSNNRVENNRAARIEMRLKFISILYNIYFNKLNHEQEK